MKCQIADCKHLVPVNSRLRTLRTFGRSALTKYSAHSCIVIWPSSWLATSMKSTLFSDPEETLTPSWQLSIWCSGNSTIWRNVYHVTREHHQLLCPRTHRVEVLSDDARLTSVVYIGPKSRIERPRKTKIGTEVAHVTPLSRSEDQLVWWAKRHSLHPYSAVLCFDSVGTNLVK